MNSKKPKNGEKATLCNMETNSFIVHIKTQNIYTDIAKNVEIRHKLWIRQTIV